MSIRRVTGLLLVVLGIVALVWGVCSGPIATPSWTRARLRYRRKTAKGLQFHRSLE